MPCIVMPCIVMPGCWAVAVPLGEGGSAATHAQSAIPITAQRMKDGFEICSLVMATSRIHRAPTQAVIQCDNSDRTCRKIEQIMGISCGLMGI
jgi:hypothetical protein